MPKKIVIIYVLIFLGSLFCAGLYFSGMVFKNLSQSESHDEGDRKSLVDYHIQQNTLFLKLVPVAMFPEPPERYLIRRIDSNRRDFVVALVFPRILSINDTGIVTSDPTDKKQGVQFALVMIRNNQPNFYVTEMLEGYSFNPSVFSNVGFYEENSTVGPAKVFELLKNGQVYKFEIGDPNLTQIKSIEVDGVQMKLKKPVAFDQIGLYLK